MTSAYESRDAAGRLNALLARAGEAELDPEVAARFETYMALLMKWNARLNLTAIREEEGILTRHFLESIVCARALPAGMETLLDFGSGAGFPGIPIALCRPEIVVTLAEAQGKKAAFLREAVRTLELSAAVYADRAERMDARFDAVAMRAVDRMEDAVEAAAELVARGGWLVLMATRGELARLREAAGEDFEWVPPMPLPFSEERMVAPGLRVK